MLELLVRLQKVKQYLSFKKEDEPHNPEVVAQYRDIPNLRLASDIDKGDLSPYALDELIYRLQYNEYSTEALMELLPHNASGDLTVDTVKKMVLNILARRINNAASFAGHIGFMGKKNTFRYPSREELVAALKEMIRIGLVTGDDLYRIANNATVQKVIRDAVEDRHGKTLGFVIDRLETLGECFGRKNPPTAEEINKSEVLAIKSVKNLMNYLEEGKDFVVALTMVLLLLKEGKIKAEKFLTEEETEALLDDPESVVCSYINKLARARVILMAKEAAEALEKGNKKPRLLCRYVIEELLQKKLISNGGMEILRRSEPAIAKIMNDDLDDMDASERVTVPSPPVESRAEKVTVNVMPAFADAASTAEPAAADKPAAPTPEKIIGETKEQIETSPTVKIPSYRPQAEAILPRAPEPETAPGQPAPRADNKVMILPPRGGESGAEIAAESGPLEETPPMSVSRLSRAPISEPRETVYPVIRHPEKSDHLLVPLVHMEMNGENLLVPLYTTANADSEGFYVYNVGSDEMCDIRITGMQNRFVNKLHCRIRIRQNTVQICAEAGITRLKGEKNTVRGWTELKPGQSFEIGEGAETVVMALEIPGEISKADLRGHMETRLAVVENARRKLIGEFRDDSEEMAFVNHLLNELENADAQFGIGCKSPESYRRLRDRTEEPRETFKKQQLAKLENARKAETISDVIKSYEAAEQMRKEEEAKVRAAERLAKIEERRQKENCRALHIQPGEDPETVPIAWRGWVIEIIDYEGRQQNTLRPMLIPSRTFGSHPACTDELINPERETIKPKYYIKEFMAEVVPHRDNSNKLLVNWIGGQIQVKDGDGNFGPPLTNPIEVTEGDTVRIGKYDLHISGKDHAFTPKALLPFAKDLIDQAIERIFEAERTTPEQDKRDYENIMKLIRLNVAPIGGTDTVRGEALCEYAARFFRFEFNKLLDELGMWTPENPVFDAKHFPTLLMLLDKSEEPDTFITSLGVTEEQIKEAAKKRIERYLAAGAAVYPDNRYHPLRGFRRISKKLNEFTNPKLKKENRREKAIADLGVIEIAKFILETDCVTMEEITLKATDAYAEKIHQNILIRNLFEKLDREEGDIVAIIGELRDLCRGRKLSDIFTDDEIAIKDLNLELNLQADESVEDSYIAQRALFAARKAYKNALLSFDGFDTATDDPTELEKHLQLLEHILYMNLFEPSKLNYDISNIKNEEQIRDIIKKMRRQVESAKERIKNEAEEEELIEESKREYQRILHQKHLELIDSVARVRKTLSEATISVDSFEEMGELCGVVADGGIDELASKLGVAVEGAKMEIRMQKFEEKDGKKRSPGVEIGEVKSESFIEKWEDVKREWWKKYAEIGAYVAALVAGGDARAHYLYSLLSDAVSRMYLSREDLGFSEEELQKGIQIAAENKERQKREEQKRLMDEKWKLLFKKMTEYRRQVLDAEDDDFDYLDETPFFEEESNEGIRERLYRLRGAVTAEKIGRCLEHVRSGDRAHYFRHVALMASEKDKYSLENLTPEEFDLLQYGK